MTIRERIALLVFIVLVVGVHEASVLGDETWVAIGQALTLLSGIAFIYPSRRTHEDT